MGIRYENVSCSGLHHLLICFDLMRERSSEKCGKKRTQRSVIPQFRLIYLRTTFNLSLWNASILPGYIFRLAYQLCRVRAPHGPEFLHAPVGDFSYVQIPFLVNAELMHNPESSRSV